MKWTSDWSKAVDHTWIQVDDLGVVKSEDDWGWTVKHIPTGTSFAKAIPPGNWSKDQLIKWCQKVQEQHQEDWTALRALTPDNYYDYKDGIVYEAKLKIRDWCLSVEIK